MFFFFGNNIISFAVPYLHKVLKNLKDSLKKCLDKRRALTRSGAAAASLPECKFLSAMQFLHEKTSNLPTHGNVELAPNDSEGTSKDSFNIPSLEDLPPKRVKRKAETDAFTRDPFLQELKDMDERVLNCMGKSRFDEND